METADDQQIFLFTQFHVSLVAEIADRQLKPSLEVVAGAEDLGEQEV